MLALVIMFLSSSCAVVTSPLTTNAWTGGWLPNASANWFTPLAPTVLNCGGSDDIVADGIAGVASPPVSLAPNPAGGLGVLVEAIFLTFLKPAAIIAAPEINPNIPACLNALEAPA